MSATIPLGAIRSHQRATTALEFAILAPVLTMFLAAAADYGAAMWTRSCISNAVSEAAYYAFRTQATGTTLTFANLQNYLQSATCLTKSSAGTYSALANITMSAPTSSTFSATQCYCPSGNPAKLGTAVGCATTCTDGTSPGTYMTISAQYTLTGLLPLTSLLSSHTITDSATVRIK